ncbi:MAG TPA: MFS transporter [Planctomycetaceae bacterium]|jgi:ACS family hexuronate transporter-like MFS transporter
MPANALHVRSPAWVWLICGILFLATFVNYGNRVTVPQRSVEIIKTFETDREGYGHAEKQFGYGFACGGLLFGVLADWISIRWLYPLVVIIWSAAGIASGQAATLEQFGVCRFVLGLFEAGHWPCSLRMTQRTFLPHERTRGNGILQSGASVAQVFVPLMLIRLDPWDSSGWRLSCGIMGFLGLPWVMLWLASVRERDVLRPVIQTDEQADGTGSSQELHEVPLWRIFISRRWWLLLLTVVCVNVPWHYIRVWMPDTLRADHGYATEFVDDFTAVYYLFTFFGSLSVGWIISWLAHQGWNVHRARLVVFGGCAVMVACAVPAAFQPRGLGLLALLCVIAFGSLGLAPIYYSFNQELSGKNQGKVGGSLSFLLWLILGAMQGEIGTLVKNDPAVRPYLFAAVGLLPVIACAALVLFWGKRARINNH